MFKKTVVYTDYNGNERTEDFYFNLTQAELMEMELSTSGGLTEMIQRIVAAQDSPAIIKIFKDLIVKSYGEKSLGGFLARLDHYLLNGREKRNVAEGQGIPGEKVTVSL